MQHLDEGTIHAWLDGELSTDDAERAARHVAECAECGALVVEARGMMAGATRIVSALDAGPVGVLPRTQHRAQPKRRSWYRFALTPARMSIAATILVAAGVTLTVQRARVGRDGVDTSPVVARPLTAATPAAAAAPALRVTDSMATVPEMPKGTPAPPNAGPQAQKTQNSALAAPRTAAAVAGKERAPESKARAADAVERAIAPAAAPAPVPVLTSIAASSPARLDSLRAKDEAVKDTAGARDRAAQIALERRQAAAGATANQLAQVMTTTNERDAPSRSEASSQNCYRLDIDSTEWRRALPSAFALGPAVSAGGAGGTIGGTFREPAANAQSALRAVMVAPGNAVHAVTATGRIDSLVVGDWRPTGPAAVSVHFIAVAKQKPVTLVLATNGSTAQLISGERTDSVRFVRMTCAR